MIYNPCKTIFCQCFPEVNKFHALKFKNMVLAIHTFSYLVRLPPLRAGEEPDASDLFELFEVRDRFAAGEEGGDQSLSDES